jgi:hypothetical protein
MSERKMLLELYEYSCGHRYYPLHEPYECYICMGESHPRWYFEVIE